MRRSPLVSKLILSTEERETLQRFARGTTTAHGVARRADIVLRFADGVSIRQIGLALKDTRQTVRLWLERFLEKRLDGLEDLPRSGRPAHFSPGSRNPSDKIRLRATG